MTRILIAEDEGSTSRNWKRLVLSFLTQEEALSANSIHIDQSFNFLETLDNLYDHEYDLVLLDHHLDPQNPSLTGLDVLTQFRINNNGDNLLSGKFVVLTGRGDSDVARSYEAFGCLEHLIKPISETQFKVAMIRAWTKLRIGEEEDDWEEAYTLLSRLGIVPALDSLQRNVQALYQLKVEVDGLQASFDEFKQQFAGMVPQEQLAYYEKARTNLSSRQGSVDSIIPLLRDYDVTEGFVDDVKDTFRYDRLSFWILESYLKRFQEQEGRVRYLHTGSVRHAEYRIGSSYRLYFREENGRKVLEGFGHKNNQPTIIDNLKDSRPAVVTNVHQLLGGS